MNDWNKWWWFRSPSYTLFVLIGSTSDWGKWNDVVLGLLCAHCLAKLDQTSTGKMRWINDKTCPGVGSNQQPSDQKSSMLPLDYCTHPISQWDRDMNEVWRQDCPTDRPVAKSTCSPVPYPNTTMTGYTYKGFNTIMNKFVETDHIYKKSCKFYQLDLE